MFRVTNSTAVSLKKDATTYLKAVIGFTASQCVKSHTHAYPDTFYMTDFEWMQA